MLDTDDIVALVVKRHCVACHATGWVKDPDPVQYARNGSLVRCLLCAGSGMVQDSVPKAKFLEWIASNAVVVRKKVVETRRIEKGVKR